MIGAGIFVKKRRKNVDMKTNKNISMTVLDIATKGKMVSRVR